MAGVTVVYVIFFLFFYYWMMYGTPMPNPPMVMVVIIGKNFCPIFALVLINYLIVYHFRLSAPHWLKFVVDFVLSVLALSSINLFITFTSHRGVEWAGTFFSDIIILIAIENLHSEKVSRMALRTQAMTRHELMRYKYEALKAQFDPHFLFNSLNILYSFIPIDPEKSQQYVLKLSAIYRYILDQGDKSEVSLHEEMKFLQSYIDILRIRYKDSFKVEITNVSPYFDEKIIPNTLQILLENVVKHNTISLATPMTVRIEGHNNYVEVSNPIIPKIQKTETRIGIRYLTNLYKSYQRQFLVDSDGHRFRAIVPYL